MPAPSGPAVAGPASAAAPSAPPPAVNPSSGMTPLPGMTEAAAAVDTPAWQVPAAWEQLDPTPIRKGNFRVGYGPRSAEITVTVFPGDVGGLLANVNRWRQQIGLGPVDEAGLAEVTEPIQVDGEAATLVDLVPPNAPDANGILGAVIPRGERTWFVKAVGNASLLKDQRNGLVSFVESISF